MKVLPFTIPKPQRDSLIIQEDKEASFYALLHQHEEFQLSYVKEGKGTIIAGDVVNWYEPGDVFVLGSNLPHVFKSDPIKSDHSHMLTVFFTEYAFGQDFFKTEELKDLHSFFEKAASGFKIERASTKITSIFDSLPSASKLERFILFMELLKTLNNTTSRPLSSFNLAKKYTDNEGRRMSAVFEYTINNFRKDIPLEVIAEKAAMTKNAFCKYFKKRTRKTYVTFLNEIRVEEACQLLRSKKEWSIAEVAEHAGFNNMSNFNRIFKSIKNQTPRAFKKLSQEI